MNHSRWKTYERDSFIIFSEIPYNFAIIFDGWSLQNTDYLCFFENFLQSSKLDSGVLYFRFFIWRRIKIKVSGTWALYFIFLDFSRRWDNVIYVIGDNCAVNKALAKSIDIPMIGCHSHRFNLALEDILITHKDIIERTNKIMLKLKN